MDLSTPRLSALRIALATIALGACADSPVTAPSALAPQASGLGISAAVTNKPPLDNSIEGEVWVCKDGNSAGTFSFSLEVNGTATTTSQVTLGDCQLVYSGAPSFGVTYVKVSEVAQTNWSITSIASEQNRGFNVPIPTTFDATSATVALNNDIGHIITFVNTFSPPPPPPPPATGCTRTIGYWKTHAGTKKQADQVTQYLPVWLGDANGSASVKVTLNTQAVFLLGYSDKSSDGIAKLRGQLLAAKLNDAAGASTADVDATILASDAFLATHGVWSGLSASEQQQVLAWKSALDDYNNGVTGPGHCS